MNTLDISYTMHVALKAHAAQFRRWPQEPYAFHLARVAGVTLAHGVRSLVDDGWKHAAQVAWLHDIVEDCPEWTIERVRAAFDDVVAAGVQLLTKTPGVSLEDYLARLADGPAWVRQIKLIDRADNLAGPFPLWDPKGFAFVEKYIPETHSLLEALEGTDPVLEQIVHDKLEIVSTLFGHAHDARYPDD